MPTIICRRCGAAAQPVGLSDLTCRTCGSSIDPRRTGESPKRFTRRQRKLRLTSEVGLDPLEQHEAAELMEWVLDLPPLERPHGAGSDSDLPSPVGSSSRLRRLVTSITRRPQPAPLYSDQVVAMMDDSIRVNRYYWPAGRKRIRYAEIRSFRPRPLAAWHGQYRVHGIDHRGRWYSRDRHRGEKDLAIDLVVGRLIKPVLTPEDVNTVLEILERKVGATRNE